MAKVTIDVPPEVLAALKDGEDRASAASLVARCVVQAARSVLRGSARSKEKAKLSRTDYASLQKAQDEADKEADNKADAAVEALLLKVK